MTEGHEIYWPRPLAGRNRKGEACTIIHQRGRLVCVRFADGTTAVLNRMGVRASKVPLGRKTET